jgi:hypothetical protein
MSITKVSDFSKDSFAFEDAVENKFGSKKIKLTASDQGPLLLKLEDCLSYGVNKFGKTNYSTPLALGGKDEFVSTLKLVEKESADHVGKPGENIMKCLYRKGNTPTLYAKIDDETQIYPLKGDDPVDHKKYQASVSVLTQSSRSRAFTCPTR